MSGQDPYHAPSSGEQSQNAYSHFQSNNPYAQQPDYYQHNPAQNPWEDEPSTGHPYLSQSRAQEPQSHYAPPPGPPPGHPQQHPSSTTTSPPPPGLPPRRNDTFAETDFVPDSERSEQREAMEQYELRKPMTTEDRDLETLQREFPGVDGSLVAALYGDAGQSVSATREVLRELAGSGT